MNRCKTCKHWANGNRKRAPHMGSCGCDRWKYEGGDIPDGVSYGDYDGYSATFETGEDFGCIHHTSNAELSGQASRESEVTNVQTR